MANGQWYTSIRNLIIGELNHIHYNFEVRNIKERGHGRKRMSWTALLGNGGELYASKATNDLLNLGNYGAFR